MSSNNKFSRYSPTKFWPQSYRFLPVWHFKPHFLFSSNWKWRHVINVLFYACRNIHNLPGAFERVRQLCDHVCIYEYLGEGHFKICCELWLDKP